MTAVFSPSLPPEVTSKAESVARAIELCGSNLDSCTALVPQLNELLDLIQKEIQAAPVKFEIIFLEGLFRFLGNPGGLHTKTLPMKLRELSYTLQKSFKARLKRCSASVDGLFQSGDYVKAVKTLRELEKHVPDQCKGRYLERLGECHMQLGQYDAALASFQRITGCKPSRQMRVIHKQVECHLHLGNVEIARELLDTCAESQQSGSSGSSKKTHFHSLITCQLRQKNCFEAIATCIEALKTFEDDDTFRRRLVDAYVEMDCSKDSFQEHFPYICSYFGEQTRYPKSNRSDKDAARIIVHLFDYVSMRSWKALEFFKVKIRQQLHDSVYEQCLKELLDEKLQFLEEKLSQLADQIDTLIKDIGANPFDDEDAISLLRKRLIKLSQELTGGNLAEIPIGCFQYLKLYTALSESYPAVDVKRCQKLQQGFQLLFSKLFGHEGSAQGLRGLFQHRLNVSNRSR